MFRETSRLIIAIGVVLFAVEGNLQAANWAKTIAASDKTNLTVVLRSGDVSVIGWDRKEAKLESNAKEGFEVKAEGHSIKIGSDGSEEEYKASVSGWTERDLKLQIPKGATISVTTLSGDVIAEQLAGRCRIKSISGDVMIHGCKGPVDIKTVSGDVSAKDIRSSLSVQTVSGDLEAVQIEGSLVEAKSVSGLLEFRKTNAKQARIKSHSGEIRFLGSIASQGSLEAKSFSGDVSVRLPAGSGFELESKTRSGDVKVGFLLEQAQKNKGEVKGRVGGGGAELELSSFSGDIEVQPE